MSSLGEKEVEMSGKVQYKSVLKWRCVTSDGFPPEAYRVLAAAWCGMILCGAFFRVGNVWFCENSRVPCRQDIEYWAEFRGNVKEGIDQEVL